MAQQSFGEQLRTARTAQGLTIAELARLSGTSRPSLSAIEAGKRSPTVDTARRILAQLGCDLLIAERTGHQ